MEISSEVSRILTEVSRGRTNGRTATDIALCVRHGYSTKKHVEGIKKNRLTKLETFCGPAEREREVVPERQWKASAWVRRGGTHSRVFSCSRWSRKSPSWRSAQFSAAARRNLCCPRKMKGQADKERCSGPFSFLQCLDIQRSKLNVARRARQFPRTWLKCLQQQQPLNLFRVFHYMTLRKPDVSAQQV